MKILFICPIPAEYHAFRTVFTLRDSSELRGCRTGRAIVANNEIFGLESGPAKARAAAAAAAGIEHFLPDIVVDTGSCGGLEPGSLYEEIVLAVGCLEYNIGGSGLPSSILPEMKLHSAFEYLTPEAREELLRGAVETGITAGFHVRAGDQA